MCFLNIIDNKQHYFRQVAMFTNTSNTSNNDINNRTTHGPNQ